MRAFFILLFIFILSQTQTFAFAEPSESPWKPWPKEKLIEVIKAAMKSSESGLIENSPEKKVIDAFLKKYKVLVVAPQDSDNYFTGGLGHVVAELLKYIKADVAEPFYSQIPDRIKKKAKFYESITIRNGNPLSGFERTVTFHIYRYKKDNGTYCYLFKNDLYFDNTSKFTYGSRSTYDGKMFVNPAMKERFGEYAEAVAFGDFNKAVTEFIRKHTQYKTVMLTDWQTAYVPMYLRNLENLHPEDPHLKTLRILYSIHNLAYQGVYMPDLIPLLDIRKEYLDYDGLQFYKKPSAMKAGIHFSDMVNSVSPHYVIEIASQLYGAWLHEVNRNMIWLGRMVGILNGFEPEKWNPTKKYLSYEANSNGEHEVIIKYTFSADDLSGKEKGKIWLKKKLGLPETLQGSSRRRIPLLGMTSRVAQQKGFDSLIPSLKIILKEMDIQIVITGDGEKKYIKKLKELEKEHPDKFRYLPFHPDRERILTAYCDMFSNLSEFEPCGLNQLYAMIYGTVPLVSNLGGLRNTVEHLITGILVDILSSKKGLMKEEVIDLNVKNIIKGFRTIIDIYQNKPETFRQIQISGMNTNFTWSTASLNYIKLYALMHILPRASEAMSAIEMLREEPTVDALIRRFLNITPESSACKELFSLY